MTVWIVTRIHEYYGDKLIGVFATKESAMNFKAADDSFSYIEIDECEVKE